MTLRCRVARTRTVVIALLVAACALLAPRPSAAQTNVVGQWTTLPYTMPINPIHVALVRTGKVVIVAGSEYDATKTVYRAAVWNPATGSIAVQTVPWDQFCNGMAFLPDGRLLVVGGHIDENYYGAVTGDI